MTNKDQEINVKEENSAIRKEKLAKFGIFLLAFILAAITVFVSNT